MLGRRTVVGSLRDWISRSIPNTRPPGTQRPYPKGPRRLCTDDPMALNPSRSAFSSTCSSALRRCTSNSAQSVGLRLGQSARQLSSSATRNTEAAFDAPAEQESRPRWSYTPERMKGPGFSINIVKDPRRTVWHNNEDPAKLDAMYNRFLGPNGERMLPEEIKWLAITHKSFDQGRRGFNTRLAYLGAS